ncbi:uncharacterized protein [Henckelia pumila]|uniref:uncharacterized protein n=1 Tax=Henckelia pumila TaxID=405737 RepID=UPI003C6E0049
MHPNKASDPDGMSAFFFQKFWDIVGFDVSQMILGVLNEGKPLDEWNDTIVTFIPKIKTPMTLKDFRPISLCNVGYKIIARTLTNRLRPLMKKSVNEFQSAFIPERLISDNIILVFETLHWIRSKKQGKRKFAALKLDMSKAYDRVEWDFLENVMIRLGFAHDWVRKRGIRQGDPLSPYLFALCAHGLSSLFIDHEARQLFSGVRITSSAPSFSHLFFADDSLIFFEGHEVYLGLPTFFVGSKRLQFRYLVERIVKRIQGWGNKVFSLGGKETLIKSVLQAIPTYAMSCFRIPVSICEDIEKECANFWWGMEDGALAKQVWRIITRPESLVAKVLKARYFKHQDVMVANCGSNSSFIWRSLVWSRSLLEKGLWWRVGNGEQIKTFHDRWIPGLRAIPLRAEGLGCFDTVSSLMDNGRWNSNLVHSLFDPHIEEKILDIQLFSVQQEDSRYWHFDPKGKYSVWEGYRVETGCYDPPSNISQLHFIKWWKYIWNLALPPKLWIFCWRELDRSDFELFVMREWAVWNQRLKMVHGSSSATITNNVHIKWMPPPRGKLRMDVDAAFNVDLNLYAIGGVVRDHEGSLVIAFGKKVPQVPSVVHAELMAISAGLNIVVDKGINIHQVSTDSLLAVQAVTCPEDDLSYVGSIAQAVRRLLILCNNAQLFHSRRQANVVAHSVAHFVLFSSSPDFWKTENFLFWLINLVNSDIIVDQ